VRIADFDCSTDVPGLYAAGDTATRELICGGFTGGGSHNAAWAASSGSWAGRGAAAFAIRRGRPGAGLRPVGGAGVRPTGDVGVGYGEVVAEVQRQVLPYDLNYLRHGDRLRPALKSLHDMWSAVSAGLGAEGEDLFRAREAAAMLAHGRWMYHAALHRTESRGMHKRLDHPAQDPTLRQRLLTGGLDDIWSRPDSARLAA
jgi:succinate dehydrogenase/fumarate reductase flavoprotein subunit